MNRNIWLPSRERAGSTYTGPERRRNSEGRANGNNTMTATDRPAATPSPAPAPSTWPAGTGLGADAPRGNATPPAVRVKNPAKVAAGKARAKQAAERKAAAEAAAKPKPKKAAAKARKPAAKAPKAKPKAAATSGKKGGKRAGAGPKVKNEASGAMVVVAHRVSRDQEQKLKQLGGADWLRQRIDRATVGAPA